MLMLDNIDYACIINTEYDSSNHKYMVFKEIKTRVKTFRDYICQPFDVQNEIKLVEDFYSPIPVFKESLYEAPVLNTGVPATNTTANNNRYMTNIPVDNGDDDDNIYEFSTRYSSSSVVEEDKEETTLIKPFTIEAA